MNELRRRSQVTLAAVTAVVLSALALAPGALAVKPVREVFPAPEDMVIEDQCAFPVLGHIEGVEIRTTFTDKAGNPVKLLSVFPGGTLTLTNLDAPWRSITVGATGSFHARIQPDGSGFFMVTGQGPVPGPEQGLWYSTGRFVATVDTDGNVTSIESTGRLVNLCDELTA